jgi:hypothetical protein
MIDGKIIGSLVIKLILYYYYTGRKAQCLGSLIFCAKSSMDRRLKSKWSTDVLKSLNVCDVLTWGPSVCLLYIDVDFFEFLNLIYSNVCSILLPAY